MPCEDDYDEYDILDQLRHALREKDDEISRLKGQLGLSQADYATLQKKLDEATDKKPVNDAVHKALQPVFQELELWFKKYEETT